MLKATFPLRKAKYRTDFLWDGQTEITANDVVVAGNSHPRQTHIRARG